MGISIVKKRWQATVLVLVLAITSATTALTSNVLAVAGDINSWQTATRSLPDGRVISGGVEMNGYLYVIGGRDSEYDTVADSYVPVSTVFYSHIESSNQPNTWFNTTSLPGDIEYVSSFAANGYIYAVGEAAGQNTKLYYAHANTDGTLGAWTVTPTLPRFLTSFVVVDNYLYAIGGGVLDQNSNADPDFTPPISYVKLNNDGSIGTWQTSTVQLPAASFVPNIVAANGYIYVIGGGDNTAGQGASNNTYYTHVNSDGSIDPWIPTKSLLTPTIFSTSIIVDDYIYTMGGSPTVSGSSAVDSVVFTHINSDGSLDDWQISEHPLPVATTGSTTIKTTDTIYVIGGWGSDYDTSHSRNVYFTSFGPQSIDTPTSLNASSPTNQKPSLTWSAVSDATSYTIYRNGTPIGTSSSTTFTDSNLLLDGNYNYSVTASNGSVTSAQSEAFTVQYDATKPVSTNASISGWLAIHWANPTITANTSDNLSGVTSGEYYIDTDPGRGNGKPMTYDASTGKLNASIVISGGTNGYHTIYIRSKDAASNWSTPTTVRYFYVG